VAFRVCLALGLLVMVSSFFVSGFSIGSFSAVNLEPGESSEEIFSLMNLGDSAEDVVVEVVVEEGGDYISLPEGTSYDVPAGEIVPVRVSVSVPDGSSVGDTFSSRIVFSTVSGGVSEGGTVDIGFGYSKTFNINVIERVIIEEPETGGTVGGEEPGAAGGGNTLWWIVGAAVVIIIIIIIWIVMKKKKDAVPELSMPDENAVADVNAKPEEKSANSDFASKDFQGA